MSYESDSPAIPRYQFEASEALQEHASDATPTDALDAPRSKPAFVEQFTATVRSSPCATNVTADYADARYYLDRAVPQAGSTASGLLNVGADDLPGVKQCLTATNLAELAGATHLLASGTVVQVFALYTRDGTKLYVFNQPPPAGAAVIISAAAGGGGKYTGRILGGMSNAVATGDLSMPEGMSESGSPALILNEEEDGLTGHRLAVPSFAVGQVVGRSAGSSVVMIRGALGATAGGTLLGDGGGGSVAPDGTAWSRQTDGSPVVVWVQTRTVWDSSGGTLYGYLRALSFDARGVLVSASGESQFTIDTATSCQ